MLGRFCRVRISVKRGFNQEAIALNRTVEAYNLVAMPIPALNTSNAASCPRGDKAFELGPGQLGEKRLALEDFASSRSALSFQISISAVIQDLVRMTYLYSDETADQCRQIRVCRPFVRFKQTSDEDPYKEIIGVAICSGR